MHDYLTSIVSGFLLGCLGFVGWVARVILTNQRAIALLQKEINDRDSQRTEDRAVWQELKDDVKEIKRDILDIYKNKAQ